MAPDPLGFIGGPNRFAYAGAQPIMFMDPWGLDKASARSGPSDDDITFRMFSPEDLLNRSFERTPQEVELNKEITTFNHDLASSRAYRMAMKVSFDYVSFLRYAASEEEPSTHRFIAYQDALESSLSTGEKTTAFVVGVLTPLPGSKEAAVETGGGGVARLALGLSDHLDAFAARLGATTWKSFADPMHWKATMLDKLADPNVKILFNLDGVEVWPGVSRTARGAGGATDWELLQIQRNPEWWDMIEWWKGGQQVANPFK